MTIFDVLTFIGGISLFLFGMNYMGSALEKKAGGQLSGLLSKFTSNKYTGFLLGLAVTAVIQSSSATTVMVVGFVNSGIMTIAQSVGVIMGANVGTTVTAWILSLTGLSGDSVLIQLLKPTSFTPILALIGVILYVFLKDSKKKDLGMILLGFAVLMFGMDTASDAVSGLKNVPEFTQLFVLFKNPILGILAGAILTGIIQSSSASVGILQALCVTGQVTVGAAFPIILGQHIGTCVTALLSSMGANKNAKRAAMIHFNFNVFGSIILMLLFYGADLIFKFTFVDKSASAVDIAIIHTACSLIETAIFLPISKVLEKISIMMIRDSGTEEEDEVALLDERLFINPAVALSQARERTYEMVKETSVAISKGLGQLSSYDEKRAEKIKKLEEKIDKYEDVINSYLVKLSATDLSAEDSYEMTKLLHVISGFERISDHAVHISVHAREMMEGNMKLSQSAKKELTVIATAVLEAMDMTSKAFRHNNIELATDVEAIEQVIDKLTAKAKNNHIERMLRDDCTFEQGLIYNDILTAIERVSDHCSDICASMIEISHSSMGVHEYLQEFKSKDNPAFRNKYYEFKDKYKFD